MNRVTRPLTTGLIAALLSVVVAATPASASDRQIALGISMIDYSNLDTLDGFTASVGRTPAIWAVWSDWGGPNRDFPTTLMESLRERSIVPMVNWEPINPSKQSDCANWSLSSIIRGDHDAYIRDWANAAKAYGGKVILRFAHEMNGYWFIWGRNRCTNTPRKFRKAWKHVWNIFRGANGAGATNVEFMWSVYGPNRLPYYYPGDAYVDYLGLSAFNWAQPGKPPWKSMAGTFAPTMTALAKVSKKPVIAGEMGAGNDPNCSVCDKAAYIRDGYPALYAKWPQIVALVYFNIDMRFVGQPDWRLESPPEAMNEYRAIVADPRFQGAFP